MGLENHLVFLGQAVEQLAAGLFQLRVQKDLRVLHHNDAGKASRLPDVGLQQRQHVDAAHALAHHLHRLGDAPLAVKCRDLQIEHLIHIAGQSVTQLLIAAVLKEILIDLPGKIIQVQLIDFVLQQPGRLKGRQLIRFLLVDQADALETVAALLGPLENTAPGANLPQLVVLLEHQKVVLQLVQLPLRVDPVEPGQDHGDVGIVFAAEILIPLFPVEIHVEREGQHPVPVGGKALAEGLFPRLIAAVLADHAHVVEQLQILLADGQAGVDAHRLLSLVEIPLLHLVTAADRAERVQHRRFSGIVLPHQNQGRLDILNLHIPYGFEVLYPQIGKLHRTLHSLFAAQKRTASNSQPRSLTFQYSGFKPAAQPQSCSSPRAFLSHRTRRCANARVQKSPRKSLRSPGASQCLGKY